MDQFSRTSQLLGDENMEKIKSARVAVFGLGAVGSFAVEALARTGIGSMVLVDFDYIDLSNINRQLLALHSTVGRQKTDLAAGRVNDINPDCRVRTHPTFVNAQTLDDLLSDRVDVVVDAIDGLNSKVNLIVEAKKKNLDIVSSMGAAGKTDISMIRTADISETQVCPLARFVRRRLRRRGVHNGVSTVYSIEKSLNKQSAESPGDPSSESEDMEDVFENRGRKRPPIGSVIWVPGVFGLTIAGLAVQSILA